MPKARVPLAGSPPGRGSQRADLSPAAHFQPVRIATGQRYGSAKQQEQMQAARPLQATNFVGSPTPISSPGPGAPGPAAPGLVPQTPSPRGPFGTGGMDPAAVLAAVSGFPTQRPGEPITATSQPAQLGSGFKLDVLRNIAQLPFSGPEIHALVAKAYMEHTVPQPTRMF